MLTVLTRALDVVVVVSDVIEAACDFERWRDDCNRTWSPVSFLLALLAGLGLLFLAWIHGAAGLAAIKSALP